MNSAQLEHPIITAMETWGEPHRPITYPTCQECGLEIMDEVTTLMGFCFCQRCISRNTHDVLELDF